MDLENCIAQYQYLLNGVMSLLRAISKVLGKLSFRRLLLDRKSSNPHEVLQLQNDGLENQERLQNTEEISPPLLSEANNISHVFEDPFEFNCRLLVMQQSIDACNKKISKMKLTREKNMDETSKKLNQNLEDMMKTFNTENKVKQANLKNKVENMETKTKDLSTEAVEKIRQINEEMLKDVKYYEMEFGEQKLNVAQTKVNKVKSQIVKMPEEFRMIVDEVTKNNFPQKIKNLENLMLMPRPQMTCFEILKNSENFHPNFTWRINENQNKLLEPQFVLDSDTFVLADYPIQARAKLEWSEDNKKLVFISITLTSMDESYLKLIPSVCFSLRSQREDKTRNICRQAQCTFSECVVTKKEYKTPLHLKETLINGDDFITINIFVEPPPMVRLGFSNNGRLKWFVNNFKLRKQMEKSKLLLTQDSPYFYTSVRGYRVQVGILLNGFSEYNERGLTVMITFLKGEFDADLTTNFRHKTTVTLLNRNNPEDNIVQSVIKKNIKKATHYFLNMGGQEEIKRLVENDTLYYKVEIEALTLVCAPKYS